MSKITNTDWISLNPNFGRFDRARRVFLQYAKHLQRWLQGQKDARMLTVSRAFVMGEEKTIRREIWPTLKAAAFLLSDLVEQGWDVRIRKNSVQVLPPQLNGIDPQLEKDLIRAQELIKRNAQLRTPSVQEFIRRMERKRLFNGEFVSIFSLMRDGRELAQQLEYAGRHTNNGNGHLLFDAIQPYIQFVDKDARCQHTGLRLLDIWRYFRHTWVNQYTSVPGRTMMILVRDAAAPLHPVIGVAALSSPIIQMSHRDRWLGWLPEQFLKNIQENPTAKMAHWLFDIVETAISEIYVRDFLSEGIISRTHLKRPNNEIIQRLLNEGALQRDAHHRYTERGQYDELRNTDPSSKGIWTLKAKTHLFRSKRALALADALSARLVINAYFDNKRTSVALSNMLKCSEGKKVVRKIVRKAKADRVGIAMADISVCGAIAPYNEVLGGKLVSILVTSPEVIAAYKKRYKNTYSEIASSVAGRPIKRPANLVFLGTTSLYGAHSSQYNRIKIPADFIGGEPVDSLQYIKLGKSEAFGTSQYSTETIDALVDLVTHRKSGQRVNSIFGEGSSPKLRKVREGIDALGVDSDLLLRHGRRRLIYGVPLAKNVREYLLGIDKRPKYIVPLDTPDTTEKLCEWWIVRWLRKRIQNKTVLNAISQHTLVEPIRHGARVAQDAWRLSSRFQSHQYRRDF